MATTNNAGAGGMETLNFPTVQGRYIRMYGIQRATQYGYSIFEFQVYNVAQCGGATERYTVLSLDIVLDNLSHLSWQRAETTYTSAGAQYTQPIAQAYCASQNMRLPTQAEALAISGVSDVSCAFPQPWQTWTSTVDSLNADHDAIVLSSGTAGYQVADNFPGGVLCNSGTAVPPPVITTQPVAQTVALGQTATFSVVATGTGTLTYQWSKNGNAIAAGGTTAIYTTPATVATDNGATFSVAVTNPGAVVLSNSVALTVTGIPAGGTCSSVPTVPVTLSTAATSSGQITLTWGASMAGPSCSVSYNVFRDTTSGFTPAADNLVTSVQASTIYVDTGLTNGTTYYYVVEAVDSNGASPASNQASAIASATATSPVLDFTLGASPASLTMTAGGSGTETVTITPMNGFPTTSAVALTCSGLPSGATCKFAPATVTSTGTIVSTLTVSTSATSASVRHIFGQFFPGSALGIALCFVGRKRRHGLQLMLLAVSVAALTLFTGCGASTSGGPATGGGAPTTSTVTVTATAGSLQHTSTFSLTVGTSTTQGFHDKGSSLFPDWTQPIETSWNRPLSAPLKPKLPDSFSRNDYVGIG